MFVQTFTKDKNTWGIFEMSWTYYIFAVSNLTEN